MWSEPFKIRAKDLREGDHFILGGTEYVVWRVNGKIWYGYVNKKKTSTGSMYSFGLKCQAFVELITDKN